MLERFTRERQRTSKASVFNLEDEGELTHYGQSLSKLDDFDDVGLPLEDDEDERGTYVSPRLARGSHLSMHIGQVDRDVVNQTHFGGFDDGEEDDDDQACHRFSSERAFVSTRSSRRERNQNQKSWQRLWLKARNIRYFSTFQLSATPPSRYLSSYSGNWSENVERIFVTS